MGTSYGGALVVGAVEEVRAALEAGGVTAIVAPVGERRTAVLPREEGRVADVDTLGSRLSGAGYGFPVLLHSLYDSDLLSLFVYQGGELVHVYHSDAAFLGRAVEGADGVVRFECGGVLYEQDDEALPRGPQGADPAVFAPFGVGDVDLERLGRLLRGEELDEDERVFAEGRHWSIAEALNLRPGALTVAYRAADVSAHAGAVLVGLAADVPPGATASA